VIPAAVERRARWVLDTLGARGVCFGDDVPYSACAWEQVERGERPRGDELADAFFHLARLEERGAPRDAHGRFPASASCLDPLQPPLERLRERLGLEAPRWAGAKFAVALTHDVDIPWRWTRVGVRGAAARLRDNVRSGRVGTAAREARGLATVPVHLARGTDPNWRFDQILATERERGARSTFFVMAAHRHRADGPSPETYERLRPRLVDTIRGADAEIGLHGSYRGAADEALLADEKERLEMLAGPVAGQRYHFLRLDPHANLAVLERLGFVYDTSLGFAETPGFRAGIAQPFRPWDAARERPLDLVEIPLAAMDATFEERYLGLSAKRAEPVLMRLLDWASEHGAAFSVLWHTNRFDRGTSAGWDRLYDRVLDGVRERGGACVAAGDLADEVRRSFDRRQQG
jgi:peptidoglycan/xylan/chitin deacetylase (PgdA/CDA1 family)